MDIKTLQIFSALAHTGSLRRTADVLSTSPTAVTRHLDKLEHHFGTALVDRGPAGVRLTAAGELLADRASHLEREFFRIKQTIDEMKGLGRGAVSLYVNGAASNAILAPALAEFSKLHPNISLEIKFASAKMARDALAEGSTDLALNMFSYPDSRIDTRYKMEVRHDPVMAPHHPLAAHEVISLADLTSHPLALPNSSFDIRLAFDAHLRAAGILEFNPTFTTDAMELQIALAQEGAAVLILPEIAIRSKIRDGKLVARPFSLENKISTTLELNHAITRTQNFAARRFLEFLEDFLESNFGASV